MRVEMVGISREGLTHCAAHAHGQWEIVMCVQGTATLHVGGQEIAFAPGVIVCQPPNVPHEVSAAKSYQDMHVRVEGFIPPCRQAIPVFDDDAEKRFSTLLRMLYEAFFKQEPNAERIVAALWDALYQLLVSWSAGRIEHPAVSALLREMVLNLSNPDFDLAAHIRGSGYSTDHFRRCFKRETGATPTAYWIALRVEHARRMLDLPDHGGYTIKQIAQLSGCVDPYYFSAVVKKHVGCSPTDYLRRGAEQEGEQNGRKGIAGCGDGL